MTDLNTPVARDDQTLVHLHFIGPGNVGTSTWIGTSLSRGLRTDERGRKVLDVTIDVDADAFEFAAGSEVLEDANDDLDEQAGPVPDPNAEVHATFGPSKPGVGKSLAAALMENDATAGPETTPAVSR